MTKDHGALDQPFNEEAKSIVAYCIILITVISLYLWCAAWLSSRRDDQRNRRLSSSAATTPHLCDGRLDVRVLSLLPVSVYSPVAFEERLECAVCLAEFREGEKVRLLQGCRHSFHADCIDVWFGSHSTCPLCRANVETDSPDLTV